jgi:thymidylate kinase
VPSSYVLQRTDGVQIEFIEALNADVDQPDLAVILTADSVVTLDRITARGTRHRFETGLTSSTQEAELYADTAARLTARRDAYRREPRRRVARRRELVGANLDHVVLDHANLNYAHLASVKHDQFTDIAEAVTTRADST